MRKSNFSYAFFLFWMSCCFVICICSSLDINANILPKVSSPPENVSESHHQSPEPIMKETKDEEVDKKLPPDKDQVQMNVNSNEDVKNIRSELVNEKNKDKKEIDTSSEKPLETAESTEAATNKVDEAKTTNAKKDSNNVDSKDSQTEPSNNVEKPTVDIKGNVERKTESSAASDDPKTPMAAVIKEKVDNQSETQPLHETAKGATGSDPPEDGSDVPTFGEYQRKFTGKRDGAGAEFKNGAKHEDSVKGGSVVTPPEKSGEATTPQPGNGANIGSVGRFKNVGSTSCGAKVIANNNEASNPAHVLNENRDEYMNHPCTANKWFVVEACEPVRLRQVDIGSYELFSSMVKTFRISASERFPQKLWDMIGTFTAKNEKGIQTYRVEQDKYYKYFKFEILDHHGNEHFCPLSLIRLYGVLVEDDDGDDEQPAEQPQEEDGNRNAAMQDGNTDDRNTKDQENSRSLLQSATKVLVDIVKKTLQPKKSQDAANQQSSEEGKSAESATFTTPQPPLTNADGSEQRNGLIDTRLSQLIKLLMSGEYSSLLKHCLDLLRRSPTVEQQWIKNEYIPSPSMAFVECSKAAFKARLSSKDLRWAYLLYNNASSSWEPEKRAALFGEMGTVDSKVDSHSDTVSETEGGKHGDKASDTDVKVNTGRDVPSQTETSSVSESQKKDKSSEVEKPQPPTPSGSFETGERPKPNVTDEKGNQGDGKTEVNTAKSALSSEENVNKKAEGSNSSNEPSPETEQLKALPKVPMDNSAKSSGESDQNASSGKQDAGKKTEGAAKTEEEKLNVNQKLQKDDGKDGPDRSSEFPQESQTQHQQKSEENETSVDSQKASLSREKPSEKVKSDEIASKPIPQTKSQETPQTVTKPKVGDPGSNGRTLGIKENAYMRLSNKLRAMEINITMSMAYLEELSRSYKKKTDKISKQMEIALQKLEETVTLGEERDRNQQKRLLAMEKQVEELRVELKLTEAKMRQENTLMRHGILLQAATLNVIVFLVHILFTLYCSRRQRATHDVHPAYCGAIQSCSSNSASHHAHESSMNGNLHAAASRSDTNLYIVDPPFRLEEHIVKKDGKKKKKRKKNVASSQQGSLHHNQFRDRSASESRIEDLL